MAGRTRPSGTANVPTTEEVEQARQAVQWSVAELSEAAERVVDRLSRIANPVERAKAMMAVRRYTVGEVATVTDDLFREALMEAYVRGRADHGWYGYGALAEQLGVTRQRVQQVLNGTWKGGGKETDLLAALRAEADQVRTVRRLTGAGRSVTEIAKETGLSEAAVADLAH